MNTPGTDVATPSVDAPLLTTATEATEPIASPSPSEGAAVDSSAPLESKRGPFRVTKAVLEKGNQSRSLAWRVKKDPAVLRAALTAAVQRSGGEGQKMVAALQSAIQAEFGIACSAGATRRIMDGLHKAGALKRTNAGGAHLWSLGSVVPSSTRPAAARAARPAAAGKDAERLATAGAQLIQGLQALGTMVDIIFRQSREDMVAMREQLDRLEQAVLRAPTAAAPAKAGRAGKVGKVKPAKAAKALKEPRGKAAAKGRYALVVKPVPKDAKGAVHPRAKEARTLVEGKKPGSEMQRVVCLAYALVGRDRETTFKTRDLSKLNNDAGLRLFSNTAVPVRQARDHRYLVSGPKNTLRLTEAGVRLVETMGPKGK